MRIRRQNYKLSMRVQDEFLGEDDLRDFAREAFGVIEEGSPHILGVEKEAMTQQVIKILKEKYHKKLVAKGVVTERPLQIKNSPSTFSRTQGYLPDLQRQLETKFELQKEIVEKYIGIFRDKILLQLENDEDPKSIAGLIVAFAKTNKNQEWTILGLRNFEQEQGGSRIKSFFDRNLSQGDTQSNLWFFFSEKKKFFEEQLGQESFQAFLDAFAWKKAEKVEEVVKEEASKEFLDTRVSPWRTQDFVNYEFHGGKPLRHVDEDILTRITKEKNCSKFEAFKFYFKSLKISKEQQEHLNLFLGKWGSWEQEGRFLTMFLKTNPGEFCVGDMVRFTIGEDCIGGPLYKGLFKYLFPLAQKQGFRGKEWPFIFSNLINKGLLDLSLFLENPFKMSAKDQELFWLRLKPSIIEKIIENGEGRILPQIFNISKETQVFQAIKEIMSLYKSEKNGNRNPFLELKDRGIDINEYLVHPVIKEEYKKLFSFYKNREGNLDVLKIRRKGKKELVLNILDCMEELRPWEQRSAILACSTILNQSNQLRQFIDHLKKDGIQGMDLEEFIKFLSLSEEKIVSIFANFIENNYQREEVSSQ